MSADDLKRAKEILEKESILSASLSDGSLYRFAKSQGYVAGHADALNSEAVQGLVKYSKALIAHIPYTETLYLESEIKSLEEAIEKFQQFKDGK